jgi:ABC-type branched-subunit amino acid transport system permease subunit/energy-coupling factor transporter ATP-binding protein EcfA2
MVTRPRGTGAAGWWLAGVVLTASAVVALVGPFPVTAAVARLAGWVLVVTGASVLLGRTGTVDLSTAAVAAVGAYVGAVALPLLGMPALVGLLGGTAAGAAVGAGTGALAGRVGARLAALPTLSVGLAVVAVLRAWPGSGGAAGYHAAPFLTGGEVGDAVAVVALAAVALAVVGWWWPTRGAARASVGARAPGVLAALGARPAVATLVAGGLGGALLGAGGAAQTMVSGSVSPGAFGLGLAAALALAVTVGGAPPVGPLVGALLVWGPAVVFPLAPVVGDAPPLLTTGVLGLALLAWRRGRPLATGSPPTAARRFGRADGAVAASGASGAWGGSGAPARRGLGDTDAAPALVVAATVGHDALVVRPGEVVAVVGPNGAGKSTLLARIGGQLPDPTGTRLHDRPAPRGTVGRARRGLARGWQRPPEVPPADLLAAATRPGRDAQGGAHMPRGADGPADLAARVAACLPDDPTTSPASAQLVAAAATRPAVVLLDEPATTLPEEVVAAVVVVLADAGVAVVLVDHRPAVLAVADRRCRVTSTATTPTGGAFDERPARDDDAEVGER